jgi:hypothetical protein
MHCIFFNNFNLKMRVHAFLLYCVFKLRLVLFVSFAWIPVCDLWKLSTPALRTSTSRLRQSTGGETDACSKTTNSTTSNRLRRRSLLWYVLTILEFIWLVSSARRSPTWYLNSQTTYFALLYTLRLQQFHSSTLNFLLQPPTSDIVLLGACLLLCNSHSATLWTTSWASSIPRTEARWPKQDSQHARQSSSPLHWQPAYNSSPTIVARRSGWVHK